MPNIFEHMGLRVARVGREIKNILRPSTPIFDAYRAASELHNVPVEDIPPQFRDGARFSMKDVEAYRESRRKGTPPSVDFMDDARGPTLVAGTEAALRTEPGQLYLRGLKKP